MITGGISYNALVYGAHAGGPSILHPGKLCDRFYFQSRKLCNLNAQMISLTMKMVVLVFWTVTFSTRTSVNADASLVSSGNLPSKYNKDITLANINFAFQTVTRYKEHTEHWHAQRFRS